jgi:hypothetical protein
MNIDFIESITREYLQDLFADSLGDWSLATRYGEFLTDLCPTLLVGHLVLCRALRHTGDMQRASKELTICRTLVVGSDFCEHAFLPELEQEEKLFGEGV